MDKFWAWWALIFYILPVIIFVPLIRRRRYVVNSVLTGIAIKYDGAIKSLIGVPYYVAFQYHDVSWTLSLAHRSKSSPAQTSIVADLSGNTYSPLRIGPEDVFAQMGKKIGLKDVSIKNEDFDRQFILKGDDEVMIREFLNPTVREILMRRREQGVTFQLSQEECRFTVNELIDDEARIEDFIQDACHMVGNLPPSKKG